MNRRWCCVPWLLLLLLLCALLPNMAPHLPSLRRVRLLRASTSRRKLSDAPATVLCDSKACDECTRVCVRWTHVRQRRHNCDRALPFTAAVWPWDAYIQCVANDCVPAFFEHACGLLPQLRGDDDVPHAHMLAMLSTRVGDVKLRVKQLRDHTHAYFGTVHINHDMVQYHRDALQHIQRCDALFVHALENRAQYSKLVQYVESLDYRIIQQEVKRLSFENDDFARHVHFWQRHNQTLQLVVHTSPEAVKHARDALYSEMRQYETDALLIKALRNGSYSKEKQARFTMRLRNKVSAQLKQLRQRNAMVAREALFLHDARAELYTLLHRVWIDISASRVNVSCGANVLSDAVTLAFKAESELF